VSEAVTRKIRVRAEPRHHPERSRPGAWFFSYTIHIENEGDEAVQLLSRHWIISDGFGQVHHVRGPGVVGEQPIIRPGDHFVYTSACPLPTAMGQMEGTFEMLLLDGGGRFDATIAPFALSDPAAEN
jgi:ApaG protein